ncbi:MAG: DUF1028 domain-containing protein [Rubrimonas sp.]|uniref:DUF1028 domain-containing protein n=1 Tax=Rubrimonas sp. TaxID=2036015 RepID=UPI002FDDB0E6
MTFSLVGRCARSGQVGVAVASSSPAVAARCAHVRAGVGAAASQNVTDPELGPLALDLMAAGRTAEAALAELLEGRAHAAHRQLLAVDRKGGVALRTGARALGLWAEARGDGCAAAGNLLADPGVPAAMIAAFEASEGALAERLMAALEAGLEAGGEAGPVRSAGLTVADRLSWPIVDLRIDWADAPVAMLRAAWEVYRPQIADYVRRALDPEAAPPYGVPGET